MMKRPQLLVRLFGGVVVLLACLCDPLDAFHPSARRSLDPVQTSSSSPSSLRAGASFDDADEISSPPSNTDRRTLLKEWTTRAVVLGSLTAAVPAPAQAAPPISIIAEELGYFPIQSSKTGKTIYVPKRVQRESSEQAVKLAAKLTAAGVTMYGAFWCPHCSRQKEMFGQKAWGMVQYVECAPQGYNGSPAVCAAANVDGYPTWVFADGTQVSGERTLEQLAKQVGFKGFRADKESNLPSGSGECK
jgi:thiol-disulfide isomerase/thioredoxin